VGRNAVVHQLPCRQDLNSRVMESKTFGVLQELKQVSATADESPGAVDPKRIVPNHPASE
jgi:hypothetical protein